MFSGIVEQLGRVANFAAAARAAGGVSARRLEIDLGELAADVRLGASVAINGVCLTVAELRGAIGGFDVIAETLARTTLGDVRAGEAVNLERALRFGDRVDGHFVQGHVDGVGAVERVESAGAEWKVWVAADAELAPFLVRKGSVALDGVSLTIVDAGAGRFSVALIPTTLERTTLGSRRAGSRVNIETDVLARTVVARVDALVRDGASPPAGGADRSGISLDALRAAGFVT